MSTTDHSQEQPKDITPLELNQASLDLLLYGNSYRDADTGLPIKAKDIVLKIAIDTHGADKALQDIAEYIKTLEQIELEQVAREYDKIERNHYAQLLALGMKEETLEQVETFSEKMRVAMLDDIANAIMGRNPASPV